MHVHKVISRESNIYTTRKMTRRELIIRMSSIQGKQPVHILTGQKIHRLLLMKIKMVETSTRSYKGHLFGSRGTRETKTNEEIMMAIPFKHEI